MGERANQHIPRPAKSRTDNPSLAADTGFGFRPAGAEICPRPDARRNRGPLPVGSGAERRSCRIERRLDRPARILRNRWRSRIAILAVAGII